MLLRLQKVISQAGIASRRGAEDLIRLGLVQVNGKVVDEMGQKVDPEKDQVRVEGKLIQQETDKKFFLFNKPRSVMTTMYDPEGRPCVKDYLKGIKERVYPVGRLDFNSEGLLLLTNDGDFANRVMHPRYEVKKTYLVKLRRLPENRELERLRRGMLLEQDFLKPQSVEVVKILDQGKCWVEMKFKEGKNREIRRMFDRLHIPVDRLRRTHIGHWSLFGIPMGKYRPLTKDERNLMSEMDKH